VIFCHLAVSVDVKKNSFTVLEERSGVCYVS
jgi:hypothetical protein